MNIQEIKINGVEYIAIKIQPSHAVDFCITHASKEPLPLEYEVWDNTNPHYVTRKYKPLVVNGEYYGILPKSDIE